MRDVIVCALGLLALTGPPRLCAGGPEAEQRLAQALRETLRSVVPAPGPAAARSEPSGEIAIEFAPNSKPQAALEELVRLEQEGEWERAAGLAQRLLEEAGDQLCSLGPRRFVPMRVLVEERLAQFPSQALAEYRAQVDAEAEAQHRVAVARQDLAALGRVRRRYLLSSCGDQALAYLATAWQTRGEYGRALRAWRRLLRLCHDTDLALPSVAAKVAVCLHMLGHERAARSLLDRADALLPEDQRLHVGGRRLPLAEVGRLVAALRPPDAPTRAGPARPGELLWSDPLPSKAVVSRSVRPRRASLLVMDERGYRPRVEVRPVVAGQQVLYPSRTGVLARNLETGKLLWEWPWPEPRPDRMILGPYGLVTESAGQWACSADARRAYCPFAMQEVLDRHTRRTFGQLVALDLADGRFAWLGRAARGLPAPLEDGYWVAPPLPCGECLILALRAGQTGQEYYLTSLSRKNGALRWRTYVCGRSAQAGGLRGHHEPAFESAPVAHSGLVVACAGDGVVAALDRDSGQIEWIAQYDQVSSRRRLAIRKRNDAWQDATPVVCNGVVFVTPTDSNFLYALELDSGRLLWRRERQDHRYLVAARKDALWLAGARAVCLDTDGALRWEASLPSAVLGRPALAAHVLHLPISGQLLFLDAQTGAPLHRVRWSAWQDRHRRSFSADIASGDLLLARDRLLVTTPYTLNVFGALDHSDTVERLAAEAPEQPAAQFAIGCERQWDGNFAAAARALERALELAARDPTSLPEATVADIHRRLAACYERAAREHERARRLDRALQATRAALHHAKEPRRRARLRLQLGATQARLHYWREAIATYQDVLRDAALHTVAWGAAREGIADVLRQAGREPYAEAEEAARAAFADGTAHALRKVVNRYPNSLAAPSALLRLAEAASRPLQAKHHLRRLTHDYPDSPQAPDALFRLALLAARSGARAMARGALAALREKHPAWAGTVAGVSALATVDPDAFLEEHAPPPAGRAAAPPRAPMEVAWQISPSYGAAAMHIGHRPGDGPDRVFLLAGASLVCRSARDGSLLWADRPGWIGISIQDADRPEGGVGVVTVYGDTPGAEAGLRRGDVLLRFNGEPVRNCAQLIALCSSRPAGSQARLHVLRGDRLLQMEFTLGERPSQPDDPQLRAASWLGVHDGVALLRRPAALAAFEAKGGERAWSVPLEEPEPATERPGARTALAAPGIVVAADTRGRVLAFEPASGQPLWTAHLLESQVHDMVLDEHALAVAVSRPPAVHVLNPFDGSRRVRLAEPHGLARPVLALDATHRLCFALGGTAGLYDLAEGRTLWRLRIADFTARRAWVTEARAVFLGEDRRGTLALECRDAASGRPLWALSLERGESVQQAHLDAEAFTLATRRAGRSVLRHLDAATGRAAWTRDLSRSESWGDWEPAAAPLCLALTQAGDGGTRRALMLALDRDTGEPVQRLDVGSGALAELRRIGSALYALLETAPAELDPRERLFGRPGIRPRFRILRLQSAPPEQETPHGAP